MEAIQESLRIEYARFCESFGRKASYYEILQLKTEIGLPLRGYFPILLQEYVKGGGGVVHLPEKFMFVHLPFVLEGLISVLYYDNQILDKKFGVVDHKTIRHNLIRRNGLYDEIIKYVRNEVEDGNLSSALVKLLKDIHWMACKGQDWEFEYNHYDSWQSLKPLDIDTYFEHSQNQIDLNAVKKARQIVEATHFIPEGKSQFLDAYFARIYLLNASLFAKTADFMLRYSDLDLKAKESLTHFAGLFGIMLQIVNDTCDFVPEYVGQETITKNCCDALSDLRNKNITLPIALHLIILEESLVKAFLESSLGDKDYLGDHVYAEELAESHAIYYSMRVGKELEKYALSLLVSDNPAYDLIKDMTSVARNNRYYRHFYSLKQHYKQYQKTTKF